MTPKQLDALALAHGWLHTLGCSLPFMEDLKAMVEAPDEAAHEGWKLVPLEPTVEMMEAATPAFNTINAWCAEMQLVRGRHPDWPADNPPLLRAWRAMLAAVPSRSNSEAK